MRIGIITYQNAHNFGACMQLFALQQHLISLGHEVVIVNYIQPVIASSYRIVKRKPSGRVLSKILYCMKYSVTITKKPYLLRRRRNFDTFSKRYFLLSEPANSLSALRKIDFKLDALIMGSDQIWNRGIVLKIDHAYFGDFTNSKTLKISYAASIGADSIPFADQLTFRALLRKIDYISVRESSAKEALSTLTEKEVEVVIDPTLLVDKKEYEVFSSVQRFKGDYIFVHVHHYTAKPQTLIAVASQISKQTGLPIVHNIHDTKFDKQLGTTYSDSPDQTLSVIRNAKLVLSQSFHITAFSIIFNKPFLVVARRKYNSRIEELLNVVNLSHLLITDSNTIPNLNEISINGDEVNMSLEQLKLKSQKYLLNALDGSKQKPEDWFNNHDAFSCYSCSACGDVCPVGAISMKADDEGFVHPYIDGSTCIHCNKCREVCIYNGVNRRTDFQSRAYISWQKNEEERMDSSSGGMFGALSKYILENEGYIIGVKYGDDSTVTYDIANTYDDCKKFRYSKYVEPEHNDIYVKTQKALETGKLVLFSGSPCKIAGLKNYLGEEKDNLYLIEIICHCSASPVIFKKYITAKEERAQAPLREIRFHDKTKGWSQRRMGTYLEFEDGTSELHIARKGIYYNAFVNGSLAKLSCYECQFCGDNGISDVTIGDFWGAQRYFEQDILNKGCSALKINSPKGEALFSKVSNDLFLREVAVDEMYLSNHKRPVDINSLRSIIFKKIIQEQKNTIGILRKYRNLSSAK